MEKERKYEGIEKTYNSLFIDSRKMKRVMRKVPTESTALPEKKKELKKHPRYNYTKYVDTKLGDKKKLLSLLDYLDLQKNIMTVKPYQKEMFKYKRPINRMSCLPVSQKHVADIILFGKSDERARRNIEVFNTLELYCTVNSTKPEIKKAVEAYYKVGVKRVNTVNDFKTGHKIAFVRLKPEFVAADVANNYGIIKY